MAKKDRVLNPLSVEDRAMYTVSRSHLYALVAAHICSMKIVRSEAEGCFFAAALGDRLCSEGWRSYRLGDGDVVMTLSEVCGLIERGEMMDFSPGERARIYDDILLCLQRAPLPF